MDKPRVFLAKKEKFGTIYQCECGCYHLQVGPFNVALAEQSYLELVSLVNESAANYELYRHQNVIDKNGGCGAAPA